MHDYLLIEGVTEDGRRFRPSDWVERLAANAAEFTSGRVRFSPLLRPVTVDGQRALAVALRLQSESPALWRMALDFAHGNKLRTKGLVRAEAAVELALSA